MNVNKNKIELYKNVFKQHGMKGYS